ncbi:hypothetical protein N1F78_02545 [Seonamhaeicola sp. MEBiC1930]|uniref:hypothetical protein n=1 Tax=Seonamhaeicola sp. MEBiC01930 TaxID=2976768 RepID=UPI00324D7464
MSFNLAFEIVIFLSILVLLICMVIIKKNTISLKFRGDLITDELNIKLKLAMKRGDMLNQKNIIAEDINAVLLTRFFDIIKQMLLLQKFIFEKSK